jgi:hypothetical protein
MICQDEAPESQPQSAFPTDTVSDMAPASPASSPSPTAFEAQYDGEIEGVRAREFYKHVDSRDCLQRLLSNLASPDTTSPLITL